MTNSQQNLVDLKVENIMVSDVTTFTLQTTVREAVVTLLDKKISGCPIVDGTKKVISVIGESTLIQLAAMGGLDKSLSEFSSRLIKEDKIVTAKKGDNFKDLIKIFLLNPVRRVVVVDSNGKIQGLVSRSNILRTLMGMSPK